MSQESMATRRLREQVEQALATSQSRKVVEPLLERLVHVATPGSEAAILAHRYLAEYRLEEHAWRALLHLKHVIAAHPDDDVAHAMCGLAHAMSGNYRAAVASYRAASQAAADNPWYHHNLGHLLDVALERPATALPHLRTAFEALGQDEPEVAASLVHCLSRMGPAMSERAITVLQESRRRHPKHASLGDLAIKLGVAEPTPAPRKRARARSATPQPIPLRPPAPTPTMDAIPSRPRPAPTAPTATTATTATTPTTSEPARPDALRDDAVVAALRERLGTHPGRFDAARVIWDRYCASQRKVRKGRPRTAQVLAAAVHRIVMRKQRGGEVTLEAIARSYGVDPEAVEAHSVEIERSLGW